MKQPRKGKDQSISGILIGDTLGELAQRLDIGEGNAKLIVIALGEDGRLRIATSGNASMVEVVGALYLAIDQMSMYGRE